MKIQCNNYIDVIFLSQKLFDAQLGHYMGIYVHINNIGSTVIWQIYVLAKYFGRENISKLHIFTSVCFIRVLVKLYIVP